MPATNYPEFNAAVTELTDRVELLLTDVGNLQSVASVQVAVDKAAEASTSATAAASSATAANGSKTAAASSATAAASSATAANTSKVAAASSATAADSSKTAAAASATTASTAATSAGNSVTASDASKVAAANSATAADSSKTAAAGSATAASSSSTKASQWADAAENTVVETGKYSAKHHAAKAAASATAAANSATSASTAKLAAESARDQAVTAASALTGSLSELGSIDLSSGVYPAKPAIAAFWKVTVGGTAGGVTYGVGDTLVYSKSLDQFYKIDNTESVSSVNGATGAVVITPDSISAQPSSANLTALAGLTGAANRLPYFTGQGALSLATLTAKARELLGAVDAAGMRAALGLGTAAVEAVTTSPTDTGYGRMLKVADFGVGLASSSTGAAADCAANQLFNEALSYPEGWPTAWGQYPSSIHWQRSVTVRVQLAVGWSPTAAASRPAMRCYDGGTWLPYQPLAMLSDFNAGVERVNVDTGAVGYGTGSGGVVTQATSKSTGVTLNKPSGQITTNAAALAANTAVSFTLTNNKIGTNDIPEVVIKSGATAGAYVVQVDAVAAGSCRISIRNMTAGSLSETPVLQFNIEKGATA